MAKSAFGSVFRRKRDNGKGHHKGWYVRWTDHLGRRRQCKGGATKDEALDFLAKKREEKRHYELRGVLPVKKGSFKEVQALAWPLVSRTLAPATQRSYGCSLDVLVNEIGDWQVCDITSADVRGLLARLEAKRGIGAGLKVYCGVLAAIFRVARDLGYLDGDPMEGVKLEKRQAKEGYRLSEREERLLLAHADEEFRPLFAFMLATGVRLGEFLGLHWQDVEERGFKVRRSRPDSEEVKNKRVRWVPLIGAARGALEDLRSRGTVQLRGASPVWASRLDYRQECNRIRRALKRAASAAGLPALGTHDFRRTFAARCDERGLTVFEIRDLLGHSSVKVTERYVGRVKQDRLLAAAERLEGHSVAPSRSIQRQ